MKVKELINLLSEQDPEKEVLIQQDESKSEYSYMIVYNVRKTIIVPYIDDENVDESQEIEAVVIDYE